MERHDAVFVGSIRSTAVVEDSEVAHYLDAPQVVAGTFDVQASWKGVFVSEFTVLLRQFDGFPPYNEGDEYVVYASYVDHMSGGSWISGTCSRTVPASVAQADMAVLPRPNVIAQGYELPILTDEQLVATLRDSEEMFARARAMQFQYFRYKSEVLVPLLIDALATAPGDALAFEIVAIQALGPAARDAIPALEAELTSASPARRAAALSALNAVDPKPESQLAYVLRGLADADEQVRRSAIHVLMSLANKPDSDDAIVASDAALEQAASSIAAGGSLADRWMSSEILKIVQEAGERHRSN